jgi:hypothetical protein
MTITKKKKKNAIAAVVASLALVAFTASPAVASAPSYTKNDKQFVKTIRAESPVLYGVGAKLLISTAKETCKFLRKGYGTIFDAIGLAEDGGLDEDTAMTMVAGAIIFYCPEQEDNY